MSDGRSFKDVDWYKYRLKAGVREALRMRAPVAGAPALVLHLGLWPEEKRVSDPADLREGRDPQDAHSEEDYNARFRNWIDRLNETLRCLKNGGSPGGAAFAYKEDPAGIAFVDPADLEFDFQWQGLTIGCLAEVHSDFATFTLVLDVGKNERLLAGQELAPEHPFAKVRAALRQAGESAADALARLPHDPASRTLSTEFDPAALELAKEGGRGDYANDLFEGFWFGLRQDILRATSPDSGDLFPGEAFAVLYGLALTAGEDTPTDYFDQKEADDAHARDVIRSHWPFISLANAKADPRDLVVCTMLNKRAIYVTALGSEAGKDIAVTTSASDADAPAVRYLVFVRPNPNTFELGRLLGHINYNGTLRLFILKEWRLFRRLGTVVRVYGHTADAISQSFSGLLRRQALLSEAQDAGDLTPEEAASLGPETVAVGKEKTLVLISNTKSIRYLQALLCELESEMYQYAAKFTGGLPFRVSRARFYIRAFKERLADLDIRAIPPYQSYIAFVRRRLYASFDYVTDIADRALGLRQRLQDLLRSIQAKAMIDLTHNISLLNKATAEQTEKLIEVEKYIARQTQSLVEIQEDAHIEAQLEKEQKNIAYMQNTLVFFVTIVVFAGPFLSATLGSSTVTEFLDSVGIKFGRDDAGLIGQLLAFLLALLLWPAVSWLFLRAGNNVARKVPPVSSGPGGGQPPVLRKPRI